MRHVILGIAVILTSVAAATTGAVFLTGGKDADVQEATLAQRVSGLETGMANVDGVLAQMGADINAHNARINSAGDGIRSNSFRLNDVERRVENLAFAVADIRCAFRVYEDGSASVMHDDAARRRCWGNVYSAIYKFVSAYPENRGLQPN